MVRRYMRAYTEAIQYYKTHKEDTIKRTCQPHGTTKVRRR
jgi:hypothetical protein